MCTCISPIHFVLEVLYIIITLTGLYNPTPPQLFENHTNVSRARGASALNNLTRSVSCPWLGTHLKHCLMDRGH